MLALSVCATLPARGWCAMANNIEALVKSSGWRPGIVSTTSGGNFAHGLRHRRGLEIGKQRRLRRAP